MVGFLSAGGAWRRQLLGFELGFELGLELGPELGRTTPVLISAL